MKPTPDELFEFVSTLLLSWTREDLRALARCLGLPRGRTDTHTRFALAKDGDVQKRLWRMATAAAACKTVLRDFIIRP